MAIEIQQMRQVVALAQHGSFVRAAAVLHISQPALSRSIGNVERRLGSELFTRTGSGVVPTDIGRVYVERARDLIRLADDLETETVTRGRLSTGHVALGGGPYPVESILGPAVARFIERYPGVQVRLEARHWLDLLQRLRSRELDFFVAEASLLVQETDVDVLAMPSPRPVYWVCRAGHPLASRTRVRTPDIFEFPFVTPTRIPPRVLEPMLRAHKEGSGGRATPLPLPAVLCDGLAPAKSIVAHTDAVTGSTISGVAAELESGQFVLVGTAPWAYLKYGMVSLKRRPWTHAAAAMREFVLAVDRELGAREDDLLRRFGSRLVASRPKPRKRTRRPR